ncbi:MAG TPA: hypothetical protein VHS76_13165 [Steroidobacteraceae bacterium]|jgi:hypothetical protein|nr:hypothetical protein [Steroidobacteraceae bacterium]
MKFAGFGVLLIGLGAFGVRVDAHATGRLADVQIIDRDTGGVLPMYRSHGEYWVAGRPGARYSIMIQNRRGERLLAVTAVDGINVISGETGAWGQSGYVFSPGESYEISGWRKSDAEIAAFNFTAAGNSYAERTGRPANVGVIGVALFLERPVRIPRYEPLERRSEESSYPQGRIEGGAAADSAKRAAPSPSAPTASSAPKLEEVKPYSTPSNMAPAQKLGTGHGARETSYAQSTTFDRLSSTPNEVIKIRYDSMENLLAMGVVPARPWQSGPNSFPDSAMPRFVPDPPGG